MTVDDGHDDDSLASIARVTTCDVCPRHAQRLRRRCHALLQTQRAAKRLPLTVSPRRFPRPSAAALCCAWCVAYLAEIIRIVAAVYLLAR